jgi:class 3 adenylate cyclase
LASERLERRLTAILAADVAGYSRLSGLDEEGTHLCLREHLVVIVNPKIAEHRGRVVKNTGDGLLAEFSSAVDAVRCAMDIQRGMAKRNAEAPREMRIDFRIGINIGDIILDRGDIFGDGVNVAARLEGVADPGGICMSDDVVKQVQGRIAGDFVYVGQQRLKNILRPVRIYRVALDGATTNPATPLRRLLTAGRNPIADGLPSQNADEISPEDQRSDGLRLLLGYAVVSILTLLLAHYFFVMKLDLSSSYLRVFTLTFPTVVGFALVWHAGRGLVATVLLGVITGIGSVFGMLAVVGLVDSTPVLPSSRFEWQEAFEYAAGTALATMAGAALARSISMARAALRNRRAPLSGGKTGGDSV